MRGQSRTSGLSADINALPRRRRSCRRFCAAAASRAIVHRHHFVARISRARSQLYVRMKLCADISERFRIITRIGASEKIKTMQCAQRYVNSNTRLTTTTTRRCPVVMGCVRVCWWRRSCTCAHICDARAEDNNGPISVISKHVAVAHGCVP